MTEPVGTILCIVGPTASGKTQLAAELALLLNGEVISADSMQVYRSMDIGTAKPTMAERRGVPHHMLDVAEPWEAYSVARYVSEAIPCVDAILSRGKIPIVAGGTGLYIDALAAGREFAAFHPDSGHRARLRQFALQQGLEPLLAELRAVDPSTAARLHPNDEKRIIRALEVWYETGKTISEHNEETAALPPRYHALTLGLAFHDRAAMWARIDRRVDEMMANGLEKEVRGLLGDGIDPSCTAMQAIGYKELASALAEGRSPAEGAEEVKLRSRQYAKRQLTWFRRNPDTRWFYWDEAMNFEALRHFSIDQVTDFGI
ncbi:MAG: tRNA delta(2)-isopentenylpyrophosphate transferase [Oscillospiraceae bacterium]|nr:tRNA delta(2)-isopentenylpyrophosphate transferase [Oscillospiraceae bacterium]